MDASIRGKGRWLFGTLTAALIGLAPFVGAETALPSSGGQLPEGGSLRPTDGGIIPEAAGMPDALTPPILRDASPLRDARPVPL